MVETLLSPSRIKLYGRSVTELLLLKMPDIFKGADGAYQIAFNESKTFGSTPGSIRSKVEASVDAMPNSPAKVGATGVQEEYPADRMIPCRHRGVGDR